MKTNILIIEDQVLVQKEIELALENANYQVSNMLTSGEEALECLHKAHQLPDLILMDIALAGKLNGIETAQKINQRYRIPIIYLTDFNTHEHFSKARETNPRSYLTKPFMTHQLLFAVELALSKPGNVTEPDFIQQHGFFPTKDGAVKIAFSDIEQLHASGQYCDILLGNGKKFNTSYPMKEVLKKIPDPNIIRISRSHCINLQSVDSIDGNLIRIGELSFTIGETYRDEVKALFNLF